ncbi:Nramp family divalent metal transporter [Streptomyces lydicus]|uniref:Nramp family divalent metal transporter n=1 Tax=Streptomyces lydicus TaxID=47763 RepID=UPI00342C591D
MRKPVRFWGRHRAGPPAAQQLPPSRRAAATAAARPGSATVSLTEPAAGKPSALEQLLVKGRLRATLAMLGPAFVAAVAYVDPGNFATNLQGGAQHGYLLLWVVLLANLMAMPVQYLSAKLGIATDRNLPELVRAHYPRAVAWGMWVQAEVVVIATDIAEVLGAALALNLLFGVPMLPAGLIAGAIAFAVLALQNRGHRRFELAITALLGIILAGFLYETLRIGPSAHESLRGFVPALDGAGSLYLAVGIIGATVMPHAIYLHSALTGGRMPCRDNGERRRVLRFERLDVIVALGAAGLVNMAMLAMAAKLFHTPDLAGLSIPEAHLELERMVGGTAALAFAVALLASGVSATSVGTYTGQVVMAGFVGIRIPLLLRRAITMFPAIVLLAVGVNPTDALVLSQVVLSFGIPFALVPLITLTSRRDVMGPHRNCRATTAFAWAIALLIIVLNAVLLHQEFFAG